MNHLIELTITFPESETQIMILEKGSEAYNQMIDYAEINEGVTSECEKVLYNEKLMLWALRGILSTNRWEEIDWLVNLHDECEQYPHVGEDGLKDIMFETIEKSDQFIRNQVWQAIMENINA